MSRVRRITHFDRYARTKSPCKHIPQREGHPLYEFARLVMGTEPQLNPSSISYFIPCFAPVSFLRSPFHVPRSSFKQQTLPTKRNILFLVVDGVCLLTHCLGNFEHAITGAHKCNFSEYFSDNYETSFVPQAQSAQLPRISRDNGNLKLTNWRGQNDPEVYLQEPI